MLLVACIGFELETFPKLSGIVGLPQTIWPRFRSLLGVCSGGAQQSIHALVVGDKPRVNRIGKTHTFSIQLIRPTIRNMVGCASNRGSSGGFTQPWRGMGNWFRGRRGVDWYWNTGG